MVWTLCKLSSSNTTISQLSTTQLPHIVYKASLTSASYSNVRARSQCASAVPKALRKPADLGCKDLDSLDGVELSRVPLRSHHF